MSAGRYFDDFTLGEVILSPWRLVTAVDIAKFGRITGESNPLHHDPEYAASIYGGLVASGCFGLSLAIGIFDQLRLFEGTAIASLGISDWRFYRPLLAGTRVRSRLTVAGLRKRTSVAGQGILDRKIELLDEDGAVLQGGRTAILLACRTGGSGPDEPRVMS